MFMIVLDDGRIMGNPKPDYLNRSCFEKYEDAEAFSKTLDSNSTIYELRVYAKVELPREYTIIKDQSVLNGTFFGGLSGMVEYTDSKDTQENPISSSDSTPRIANWKTYAIEVYRFLNPFS